MRCGLRIGLIAARADAGGHAVLHVDDDKGNRHAETPM